MLNNDLLETKNDVKKLINYYIIEYFKKLSLTSEQSQDYKYLYKKCYDIVNIYKKEWSLLYNLDILNEKSKILNKIGYFVAISFFSLYIFIVPVFLAIPFIIMEDNNRINHIALLFGFGEKDIYDYGLNEYIYEKQSGEEIKIENSELNKKKLERINEKFKNKFYYIGPSQCLIKSKEIFKQIMDLLNDLGNRSEEKWNEFKVEKI